MNKYMEKAKELSTQLTTLSDYSYETKGAWTSFGRLMRDAAEYLDKVEMCNQGMKGCRGDNCTSDHK